MNRVVLEKITASLVVVFISILIFGAILIFANMLFAWDLFPPFLEKILYFLGISMLFTVIGCLLINIMINISRLTFFAQKITEKFYEKSHK